MLANIDAIKAVKTLEDESREPSSEEKSRLVRFTGWGAFAQNLFTARPSAEAARTWGSERSTLQELLTTQEWEAARASTINAHYTSKAVIDGLWTAVRHLGFEGGRAIEPAAGVGHFIGLTPEDLLARTVWSGVELDPVTARIAQHLYPGADIRNDGFESAKWPDAYFDLAISNVPFGNYGVKDNRYRSLSIHDYFFVKSLEKVRPGGVVAFITSHYTLDKKNDGARRTMARLGEFLGAIRLPGGDQGAFKANAGTEVTADIIFLRRKSSSETLGQDRWLELAAVETPDGPIEINRYFADNPQMMLGAMGLEKGMHATPSPVLRGSPEGLDMQIARAAENLPKNAFFRASPDKTVSDPSVDASKHKEGALFADEGRLFRSIQGTAEDVAVNAQDKAKLLALIEIKETVNALLKPPSNDDDARNQLRRNLNRSYDRFTSLYGPINKTSQTVTARLKGDGTPVVLRRMPNFGLFRDDPDAFKVAALETYDEQTDTAKKTAIFTHDVVRHTEKPVIESASDALAVSLNQTGTVDLSFIADALDVDEDEALAALGDRIWLDPAGDIWRTAADYLSGDVVQKLDDARLAASDDERYARNVAALEQVQPAPLTRVDIRILCGAPWVPAEVYRQFLTEAIGIDSESLVLNEISKKWAFTKKYETPPSVQALYGTARAPAKDTIAAALNNGEIRIFDPGPGEDAPPVYNAAESEEANAKVIAIRDLFSGSAEAGVEAWIWQDDIRAAMLEELYNKTFNRLVPTVYDGSHQSMPGLARFVTSGPENEIVPFHLNPHQLNVIWRIVQTGNTLIDHAVGAGKTFTMIGAGQEQKRLGLIRRPMYVVPNHMVEQFGREFLQAYPAAEILVADKESMTRDKRRAFGARIAAGAFDAVIITHDAFGRIRMSDEASKSYIGNQIEELRDFKERATADEGKASITVKELEKAVKRLELKYDKLLNQTEKDDGIIFEELGVDFLFVDEAHAFKNLSFMTRHGQVKGISGATSQRATDLDMKITYLEQSRPGRSVAFATGTPISNSIAEMFTMQRYLQRRTLSEYGIDSFDAWAATFGDIVTAVELAPSGRGFRTTRSFSKFVNIPELIAMYSRVADTQTAEMLNLPRPKLKNGQVSVVECELSQYELIIMDELVQRAEAIKGKRAEAGRDNMLKILGEGLRLATDIRLLDPNAEPNSNGKIVRAVEKIESIWRTGKAPALCQLVFLDMGVPGSARKSKTAGSGGDDEGALLERGFNLYEDIRARLVAKGVPQHEIAFIHEAGDDIKKARLFQAVRDANVRILIGSTGKMGVGTNVQTYLTALHQIDAPWRPADVEQRDGRGLRQGNLNPEIEIIRYISKRSLDAYRWQTLDRKARFIGQIRAGARGIRTAEDIDSPLPEAAMIKAAATGNPIIIEHAELSKEKREIEAARRGHERSQQAARSSYERLKLKIEKSQPAIEALRGDAAKAQTADKGPFSMTIDGRSYDERKDAGGVIKAVLMQEGFSLREGERKRLFLKGDLSGFSLEATVRHGDLGLSYALTVSGKCRYEKSTDEFALNDTIDAVGLIRRMENRIKQIPAVLAKEEDQLRKDRADLPRLERQLTATAFAREDRLYAISNRILEIEKVLKQDQQTKPNEADLQVPEKAAFTVNPDAAADVLHQGNDEALATKPMTNVADLMKIGGKLTSDELNAIAMREKQFWSEARPDNVPDSPRQNGRKR